MDLGINCKTHYAASQDLKSTRFELAKGVIITIALDIGELEKSL